jgi:hypothetical protein
MGAAGLKRAAFDIQTPEGALDWMLERELLVKRTTKDPETYATSHGFVLSDQLRDVIGCNLVKLVAKVTRKRNGSARGVSVRDAFLTATIAAVLETTRAPLNDDEITNCANIIFALLPIGRLEETGLADRSLRAVTHNRSSVRKLQDLLGPHKPTPS